MFGDVGQRFLGDAVQRQTRPPPRPVRVAFGAQRDRQPGCDEIVYQIRDVVDAGFGGHLLGPALEQPHRAPDICHRLSAQLLGVVERVDRVVDIAVLLQRVPRTGHVQQRDGERMGDDVVHLTGDAASLVGGGVLGQFCCISCCLTSNCAWVRIR